jgi:hypothetical protein
MLDSPTTAATLGRAIARIPQAMSPRKRPTMAYVPKNAEWFLANLVLEIRVEGSRRNVVHINHVIIHARSPEDAYARAMRLGKRDAISYLNPHGRKVTIRFRGLGNLDVIFDPLGDECEVMFQEKLGVSEKGIQKLVVPKRKLEVFMPIRGRRNRPDYSSMDILEMVKERLERRRAVSNPKPPRN